ncbi:MAG: thiamine pyrophosphate-dependent enzyme [Sediminibacterium sp.]|nr:thiamine pyrophosphate-dependent enzyme [Sediminibacterium sp.]
MNFNKYIYPTQVYIDLYKKLLLPRMIEEKMLVLLRQGKISKWFSGIGQEAISVGVTAALENDEWIFPLHRNLGVFTSRNIPLYKLFRQWQGNFDGFSKGRERSFHFGTNTHFICGMISHLGPQLALADGVALAYKLKKMPNVSVAFTGDGGTSEGDFHEALNMAAVWDLPVIFIIENNGYGLSTPTNEQYRCNSLVDKAIGYGIKGIKIDGNNILEVFNSIQNARTYCIEEQKPILIECITFRMRGHEEASGIKYVPNNLLDEWAKKDPIKNFEHFLIHYNHLSEMQMADLKNEFKLYIETELSNALIPETFHVDLSTELNDVYAKVNTTQLVNYDAYPANFTLSPKRFINGISEGLFYSLQENTDLIIMGQDIAGYGGAFKVTENFITKFGKHRIRNTPICESAVIGIALGLSLMNIPAIVEMQFADFVSVGFNQIVNNLAKIHYRWGQAANVVIRMPTGAGVGAGPFHSQSNEAWFTHIPGLKVVYPSNTIDAKGLLIAAMNDNNPILYFEHKALYRSFEEPTPIEPYFIPIGKAKIVQNGTDITVITYGMGVHWIKEFQSKNPHIALYILDLRTLLPLDYVAIKQAVIATGKILILHEDTLTGAISGEIAAWISEHCFEHLDAPIMRCASLDTPIPFNVQLEKHFLANNRLNEILQKLLNY